MSIFANPSSTRKSDDTMDDDTDEKDDTKRKTRNLSEKKRRDQFNLLINELSSMVSTNNRKMDKSTVLKSTISFLKNHNDVAVQSRANEIQEDWKPNFLTNEEFTHLFLEALDGFIIVLSSSGRILYASESITSLLGYFPNDLMTMSVYDLVYEGDHSELYNVFLNPDVDLDENKENQLSFTCHCKRGSAIDKEDTSYEVVQFLGQFRSDVDSLQVLDSSGRSQVHQKLNSFSPEPDTRWVFVGMGRLRTPQLIRELSVIDSTKSEFTSRHSLEWKFLFLDHRAPPIIGYLPFEVLGTSGYDYYHVDDLDKVVDCHEALMQKGEGTSCYYRFLTKGQQWIWLQTRFYITYHQWNSKPEFIVCTHRVVSYVNVLKQATGGSDILYRQGVEDVSKPADRSRSVTTARSSSWSSKSGASKKEKINLGSDNNSLSADSPVSKHSHHTTMSAPSRHIHAIGSVETGSVKSEKSSWHQPPTTTMDNGTGYVTGTSQPHTPQLQSLTSTTPEQGQPFTLVGMPTQPAAVLTTLSPQRVDLLEKRQEELQQRIVEQQTELRQVTEQLFFAKYGLFPPTVLNVPLQYATLSAPTAPEMYMAEPHPHQVEESHYSSTPIPFSAQLTPCSQVNQVSLHSENVMPLQQSQVITADTLFSPMQLSPSNSTHSPCH